MSNLINKMDQLSDELKKAVYNAEEVAIRQLLAKFTRRIFNEGKATNGLQIGNYSTRTTVKLDQGNYSFLNKNAQKRTKTYLNKNIPYIELRRKAGRQVAYVDLQFTDRLFNSVVVGYMNGSWTLGFNNLERAKIARENEVRFKKTIFEPSEEEIAEAKRAAIQYIGIQMQNLFNTW